MSLKNKRLIGIPWLSLPLKLWSALLLRRAKTYKKLAAEKVAAENLHDP